MNNWYRLIHRKPVPFKYSIFTDAKKHCKELDKHFKSKRHIRQKYIGDYHISTIFLGLDHGYDDSEPILFETMIFNDGESIFTDRCSTHRQALAMHKKALEIQRRAYGLLHND